MTTSDTRAAPPISPAEVALVRASWALVEPIADEAARLFYARLFELDPGLRALFKDDMGAQQRALMQTLAHAVAKLDHLDQLVPVLESLGQRHADYGVEAKHFEPVGAAFIWTLEKGLGDAFTDDVRGAWLAVYACVADTMKSGMLSRAA